MFYWYKKKLNKDSLRGQLDSERASLLTFINHQKSKNTFIKRETYDKM